MVLGHTTSTRSLLTSVSLTRLRRCWQVSSKWHVQDWRSVLLASHQWNFGHLELDMCVNSLFFSGEAWTSLDVPHFGHWCVFIEKVVDQSCQYFPGMLVFFTAQTITFAQFQMHGQPAAAHSYIAFLFLYYAAYEWVPLLQSFRTCHQLPLLALPSLLWLWVHSSWQYWETQSIFFFLGCIHHRNSSLSSTSEGFQYLQLHHLARPDLQPIREPHSSW